MAGSRWSCQRFKELSSMPLEWLSALPPHLRQEIEEATDDIPCSQIPGLDMAIDGSSISNFSSSVLGDDGCVVVLGSLTATS
ncbi:hypothetical protein IGI04_012264 [Brassica rapa subsp. trilocularis]|uniref:Uncharacterized protein n=1 Tax=Brassica rapa subsp. trilocularis TaxID=1813537 RepID=A0ABQ7N5G7_BRACM|nr:hypothetical protein IGI04_012264 [Brassica rapa subsp. trilocularis]